MFGIRWDRAKLTRRALTIISAAVVILIGIIGQDIWTQRGWTPMFLAWMSVAYANVVAALWPHGLYLAIVAALGTALWLKHSKLRIIYIRYEGLREKPPRSYVRYDKQPRDRWENIGRVRYGHINYPGLLTYDQFNNPEGFGLKLIRELFNTQQFEFDKENVKIKKNLERSDWSDVLEQLEKGEFDLIATPMLETFERSSRADFTMPMFFSNIGLYISSTASGAGAEGRGGFKNETLVSTVEKLAARDDAEVEVHYVPGEISEKQGRKLHERLVKKMNGAAKLVPSGNSIISMLEDIETAGDVIRLAFCESFHVQIGRTQEGRPYRLTNILENYHILYPVCYAVRNGDYILRNRLNIGLLKMTAEGDGIVRRLSDTLNLSKEAIQAHFVSGWNDPRT